MTRAKIAFSLLTLLSCIQFLQAQELFLRPMLGFQTPTSRVYENELGYPTFSSQLFSVSGQNAGLMIEFDSEHGHLFSVGYTVGGIGFSYKLSYENPSSSVYGIGARRARAHNLMRIPLLYRYDWKKVRFWELKGHRNARSTEIPKSIDKNVFYLFLFKLRPVFGVSLDYISNMHDMSTTNDSSYNFTNLNSMEILTTVDKIRNLGVAAVFGFDLQFYGRGEDKLALSLLYYQGIMDLYEMNVNYTIDGNGPYFSTVRSRGSGLSFTLSYPIRVFTFDKEERQLRKQNK